MNDAYHELRYYRRQLIVSSQQLLVPTILWYLVPSIRPFIPFVLLGFWIANLSLFIKYNEDFK